MTTTTRWKRNSYQAMTEKEKGSNLSSKSHGPKPLLIWYLYFLMFFEQSTKCVDIKCHVNVSQMLSWCGHFVFFSLSLLVKFITFLELLRLLVFSECAKFIFMEKEIRKSMRCQSDERWHRAVIIDVEGRRKESELKRLKGETLFIKESGGGVVDVFFGDCNQRSS